MDCVDKPGNEKALLRQCDIISEDEIRKYLLGVERSRILLSELADYCKDHKRKILALTGLRRTGKTILMMQQALALIDAGKNVRFLQISDVDTQQSLFLGVDSAVSRGAQYIFIDEVTYVDGFAKWADWIYNHTVLKGIFCILSGTDSFSLVIAAGRPLFDRIEFIETTHISYRDYKYVVNGALTQYIHNGGVFGGSNMVEYINTSVVDNIVNSINRYSDYGYRVLDELTDDELRTVIIKTVSNISIRFIIRNILRNYRYPELGSAKDLLTRKFSSFIIENEDVIKNRVYASLRLREDLSRFTDKELDKFMKYLRDIFESIDVVIKYDNVSISAEEKQYLTSHEYILTQPVLRFEQTSVYLRVLGEMGNSYQLLIQTILQDMEGNLLEAIVMGETVRTLNWKSDDINRAYDVFKFGYLSAEIDLAVFDCKAKALHLFEVKRTSGISSEQLKYLNDADTLNAVKAVTINRNPTAFKVLEVRKYILYSGLTEVGLVKGVKYINVEEYLLGFWAREG